MNENIRDLKWRPYPEKTSAEDEAFAITSEALYSLPPDRRSAINKIRADYVGKLISHRCYLGTDYDRLKEIRTKAITSGKKGLQKRAEELILEHREMEKNIDSLTINIVFKGRRYCKLPAGVSPEGRPFQQRAPRRYASQKEEAYV